LLKFFVAAFFIAAFLFVMPTGASADDGSGAVLRHAYKPVVLNNINMMQARVNNHTSMPQKRLVCVEAFNTASNAKTHLGCLWVDLAAWGSEGMYASQFNVPLGMLMPGNYNVVYTYQGDNGAWYRIKSINMQVQDGTYSAM
jgi:hypothetical protein